jgi:hypothetical protein
LPPLFALTLIAASRVPFECDAALPTVDVIRLTPESQ